MTDYKYIGKSSPRRDGRAKVSGAATFTDDIDFGPTLLYAAVVESPHAHAEIISIDTSKAEQLDGVVRIVLGKEFPYRFGLYMHDRYIFAQDKVRFVGEQVAAVIARDEKTAYKAAKLVEVKYRLLEPVLKVDQAIGTDPKHIEDRKNHKDSLIHPELEDYEHVPWFFPKNETNIAHFRKIRKGDLGAGFDEADHVFEETYVVPRYAHCAIENHAAIGKVDQEGRLTVWTASQSPHTQRHLFAQALEQLGFTHNDVRVVTPFVGGGFGGKAGVSMEIIAAACATTVPGNPVKVLWTREQEFRNTYQRQGIHAKVKMGVKNDGTITALENLLYWDAGAYVEYGANVVNASGLSATGPYRIPHVKIDSVCVYTNLPPGGPYRGFGYSEFLFGLESHIDTVANALKIDRVEFRKINAIKENDTLCYGGKMNSNGLQECIDKAAASIEWGKEVKSDDPNKVIGKGFSLLWKAPAMPPNASSSCFLKFNEDASINLLISGMEIGQGYFTVMAQCAAEVLGIPPEMIRCESPDTDRNPYEWQTVASHITWSCGNAVIRAAEDARDQIFNTVHRALGKDTSQLYLEDKCVRSHAEPTWKLPLKDFVIEGIMLEDGTWRGGPVIGRGIFMPEFTSGLSDPETSQGGKPNVHYTVGAAGVILEIDKQTGRMKPLKVALAVDCGKALNPDLVRGQMTGGMLQGLATVLYEDMRFDDKGKLLNASFTDYKIPTALDVWGEMDCIIVENPQPDGPFGARGMGEHTMIPSAPMVANAIHDAMDIRIKSMPVTAEKVALAAEKKRKK
ncbi:MAG: xanthine dehydrogenase family protein molybdopterin-binding subunit [Bacteriovoracaceae bacterium]|nr:xanthine dehydrogenase family protein molybdopterin-binding subunit [Bacteriovoracaceae bacterium]